MHVIGFFHFLTFLITEKILGQTLKTDRKIASFSVCLYVFTPRNRQNRQDSDKISRLDFRQFVKMKKNTKTSVLVKNYHNFCFFQFLVKK